MPHPVRFALAITPVLCSALTACAPTEEIEILDVGGNADKADQSATGAWQLAPLEPIVKRLRCREVLSCDIKLSLAIAQVPFQHELDDLAEAYFAAHPDETVLELPLAQGALRSRSEAWPITLYVQAARHSGGIEVRPLKVVSPLYDGQDLGPGTEPDYAVLRVETSPRDELLLTLSINESLNDELLADPTFHLFYDLRIW